MLWLVLIAIAGAIPLLLYGLFRWASADSGIDADIANERFRAEQKWRSMRRSGNDADEAKEGKN